MADKKENCNVPNKIEDRYGIAEYAKLIRAFDFFNEKLFGKRLPDVMFTIARHRGANGYFWQDAFQERKFENEDRLAPGFFVHEIAIMPDAMHCRPDRDVLSTLVHEMAHLEQAEFGKKSRNGYHNREWAKMMLAVGLQASTLGALDVRNEFLDAKKKSKSQGAESGQSVSHFIIKGGVFDKACTELLATGFSFKLDAAPKLRMAPPKSKFKYTCPGCGAKAWAKKDCNLMCGDCKATLEMEDED